MASSRFTRVAWGTVGLTVAVIAGGAVVRATGSGAGCGSNWPTCQGEVVPLGGTAETMIEFSHRASSGLAFLAVIGLALWGRRLFAAGSPVRRALGWAALFMVGEVAIGAMLVRNEWVADDASVARAVVDGLHLVNTLFLVAALALAAWWSSGRLPARAALWRPAWPWLVAMAAIVVVAAAGALTALGDTLFPEATVGDDFDSSSHFLVRLRVFHPVLAVMAAVYLGALARFGARAQHQRLATALGVVVVTQVAAGVVNLGMGAPVWMQVVHILLTDALWILLVLLTAEHMAPQREPTPVVAA